MRITKPMLAASMEDSKGNKMTFKNITYPCGASVKLDGIRCIQGDGVSLSRSFKKIKNLYVQNCLKDLPSDLDGELVTYNADGTVRTFNEIQGDIMSSDGEPNFKFEIFDYVKADVSSPYTQRIKDLQDLFANGKLNSFCSPVYPTIINSAEELEAYEAKALAEGHEGIMVRSLKSPYREGRATWNQGYLIKIKRMVSSEAVIIGFVEKQHNENEATKDELGHTKRSSAKAGMVPANTLGKFLVRDIHDGREFSIGTGEGLGDVLRKQIWDNQAAYQDKIIHYEYQLVGTKDNPRIPSFKGFRDPIDL